MNYKTILVAMFIMAMIVPSAMAGNKAYTIIGCEDQTRDLMTGEYNCVGVDSWSAFTNPAVADVYVDGNIVYITPLTRGKGNLYYTLEKNDGTIVNRTASITVISNCATCPTFTEQNEMYDVDGSWFEITNAPAGTWHDGDANGNYTRKAYLWTCSGAEWVSQICFATTPIPSGSVVEVRSTNKETSNIISTYAYM